MATLPFNELIPCDKCKDECIGSAVDFKPRFWVHKSVIKTKKNRWGASRHFNEKCLRSISPFGYAKAQIVEQVYSEEPLKIEEVLWYIKKILVRSTIHSYPWDEQH